MTRQKKLSEAFTGKALSEYPRDSYYVADKFNFQAQPDYRIQFPEQPAACIGCGACTAHCPQSLPVPEAMAEMSGQMANS
jgi:formate hydrogenlyase subunit 6/NADH:ubiquinone oxidoreductase subunit I